MIDEGDPEPSGGDSGGPASAEQDEKLRTFSSFLLEEHRQRSAEIMQNKLWRYSVRIFAALSIYVYHTKVYLSEDYRSSTLGASVLLIILACCVLYSISLRYRTRFNADYKSRIEQFFVGLPEKMQDVEVEALRIRLKLDGWETYIALERQDGRFDAPQIRVEAVVWTAVIFGALYLYFLPTVTST